jgi:DNA polymerase-4
MDAFYAAIEQRDSPELRGKPIVVGGPPESRGVVATASYEARVFGIRSAMPSSWAKRACPQAIFIKPRMNAYREASKKIMDLLREYTDLVEPLSLDEAYLDVTENKFGQPSASLLASEIRQRIFECCNLTASAGVAPNKFLAKIASDMQKPNGLTVIPPERVDKVLSGLPVGRIPGIGSKTEGRMHSLGIRLVSDLRSRNEEELREYFGKNGSWYYRVSRGLDERPVNPDRSVKSVSTEETFATDLVDPALIREELSTLSRKLLQRLERKGAAGRTLTLKVTYEDFSKITRSRTFSAALTLHDSILEAAEELLAQTESGTRPIRLLGLGVSNLEGEKKIEEERVQNGAVQLHFKFTFHGS